MDSSENRPDRSPEPSPSLPDRRSGGRWRWAGGVLLGGLAGGALVGVVLGLASMVPPLVVYKVTWEKAAEDQPPPLPWRQALWLNNPMSS